MNKIFVNSDDLLDEIFTFIQKIKRKYINIKLSTDDIKLVDEYVEMCSRQLISLDSIISDHIEIKNKRKQYILATQNYINQLEDLKSGTDRINMISYNSNRDSYLPVNRISEYALSSSFDTFL